MKNSLMVKTGGIYLGLSMVSNFINLLLTPIYTNNLTLVEYGSYSIITSYQSLFSIFVALGIFSGMKRFFNEYEDKNRLKNIALTFSVVWGVVIYVLSAIFAGRLAVVMFAAEAQGVEYIGYIVISTLLLCIISIYTAYYSMQYKALKASLIEIAKLGLTLVFAVIFVVAKDGGIIGILQSQCLSYIIVLSILFFADYRHIRIEWGKGELKDMLSYGIGMAGASDFLEWLLTLVDRYFLRAIMGYATVAVYSIGYKVGMLIMPFLVTPFINALIPYKYSVYKDEDGKRKLEELFDLYNIVGWFAVLGISIYANITIKILATDDYSQAFMIVPFIVMAYLLDGSCEFYSLGIHIEKKVVLNLAIPGVATLLNIMLNLALIPRIGAYGAAISTLVSYFAMTIMYYFGGRVYYRMEIGVGRFLKAGIPFFAVYTLYLFFEFHRMGMFLEFLFNSMLVILYLFISFVFGFMPKSYAVILRDIITDRLAKREAVEDEDRSL